MQKRLFAGEAQKDGQCAGSLGGRGVGGEHLAYGDMNSAQIQKGRRGEERGRHHPCPPKS